METSIKFQTLPLDCSFDSRCGQSLALSCDSLMAIGVMSNDHAIDHKRKGEVYVVDLNTDVAEIVDVLHGTESFGKEVAMSGDGKWLYVVSPDVVVDKNIRGVVSVYRSTGDGYEFKQDLMVPASSVRKYNHWFGNGLSVSYDGSILVVAEKFRFYRTDLIGAVYVYRRVGNVYVLCEVLSSNTAGDGYGTHVAIDEDGSTVYVGCPYSYGGGTIVVYKVGRWVVTLDDVIFYDSMFKLHRFGDSFSLIGENEIAAIVYTESGGKKFVVVRDNKVTFEKKLIDGSVTALAGYKGVAIIKILTSDLCTLLSYTDGTLTTICDSNERCQLGEIETRVVFNKKYIAIGMPMADARGLVKYARYWR